MLAKNKSISHLQYLFALMLLLLISCGSSNLDIEHGWYLHNYFEFSNYSVAIVVKIGPSQYRLYDITDLRIISINSQYQLIDEVKFKYLDQPIFIPFDRSEQQIYFNKRFDLIYTDKFGNFNFKENVPGAFIFIKNGYLHAEGPLPPNQMTTWYAYRYDLTTLDYVDSYKFQYSYPEYSIYANNNSLKPLRFEQKTDTITKFMDDYDLEYLPQSK